MRSVYIVPATIYAKTAKQKISLAASTSNFGFLSVSMSNIFGWALVEHTFLRIQCKCPLIVAYDCGKCFSMACVLIPRIPKSWFLSSAFNSVAFVGEKRHWCKNCINFPWLDILCIALI